MSKLLEQFYDSFSFTIKCKLQNSICINYILYTVLFVFIFYDKKLHLMSLFLIIDLI